MQVEAPAAKSLIKLERLADEINAKFSEAVHLANESKNAGNAAVNAAIYCGGVLIKAKRAVGHGAWEKWLLDNCPNIHSNTARKWMRLSKSLHSVDLTKLKNISEAYRLAGILPDAKPEPKGIGTQEVDIFDSFVQRISRLADTYSDFDLSGMSEDRKAIVRQNCEAILEKL